MDLCRTTRKVLRALLSVILSLPASLLLPSSNPAKVAAQQQQPSGIRRSKGAGAQRTDIKSELRIAVSLLQEGKLDEAEPIVRRAVTIAPRDADAHGLLGVILDQRGKFADAEREYRTALAINPNALSPLANLGVLLARTGRSDEAIKAFESVLRMAPDDPPATINLGLQYLARGENARAASLLGRAIALGIDTYASRFNFGVALYNLKRFDEAASAFETAATLSPGSAEPYHYLGLIAWERNQDEAAEQLWKKTLSLRPDYPEANFMLGEILAKQKRYAEAVGFYEKAAAQDKTKSVYFVRLGGTYLLNYEPIKAFQYFREAAELFPDIAEIKYFYAIAARSIGEYDLAFSEAKKALALKETADINALLGSILVDRNNYPEAEKYLRRAIVLNPNHFNSQHAMGRILVKQQRFAEALPFLQRAESLMPNIADIHYQLFLTYTRLKRKAEAAKEFELFKQLSKK